MAAHRNSRWHISRSCDCMFLKRCSKFIEPVVVSVQMQKFSLPLKYFGQAMNAVGQKLWKTNGTWRHLLINTIWRHVHTSKEICRKMLGEINRFKTLPCGASFSPLLLYGIKLTWLVISYFNFVFYKIPFLIFLLLLPKQLFNIMNQNRHDTN